MGNNVRITNKGGEDGATFLNSATNADAPSGAQYECIVPDPAVTFDAITTNWDAASPVGVEFTRPMYGNFSGISISAGRCVCYKKRPN